MPRLSTLMVSCRCMSAAFRQVLATKRQNAPTREWHSREAGPRVAAAGRRDSRLHYSRQACHRRCGLCHCGLGRGDSPGRLHGTLARRPYDRMIGGADRLFGERDIGAATDRLGQVAGQLIGQVMKDVCNEMVEEWQKTGTGMRASLGKLARGCSGAWTMLSCGFE